MQLSASLINSSLDFRWQYNCSFIALILIKSILKSLNRYNISCGSFDKNDSIDEPDTDTDDDGGIVACFIILLRMTSKTSKNKKDTSKIYIHPCMYKYKYINIYMLLLR